MKKLLSKMLADQGMLVVLLLLCAFFSWATLDEQHPTGAAGALDLSRDILAEIGSGASVVIAARDSEEDVIFADTLERELAAAGVEVLAAVKGGPVEARQAIEETIQAGKTPGAIACNQATAQWGVFEGLAEKFPPLAKTRVMVPRSYSWPDFLKPDNLLNVADQIVVIAVIAIGMTMVIIAGGIDLSVGSLIALSAVVAALLIRDAAGAEKATVLGMVLSSLGGIAVCGLIGLFSGVMVTIFAIPPFIVTLGMMLVASGLSYILAEGQSIYQVPDSFIWLGRGAQILSVPNGVVLMVLLYAAAHVMMTHMRLGRHVYSVGGNAEAARLSGIPVRRITVLVYTICAAMAGLGGIVMASQLKSGSPTYGRMYELYVIAAVVVGGTSLSGGEGRIAGTLVGAFIIAVIQNGMNLTGVQSYTQNVVLGLVILGAVLLDTLKRKGWGAILLWRRLGGKGRGTGSHGPVQP